MDERNNQSYTEPWERHSYENGSTRPPKSRGGVIAVLLCVTICLCGIVSALGILDDGKTSVTPSSGAVNFSNIDSQNGSGESIPPSQVAPNPDNQLQMELEMVPGQVDNVPQAGGLGLQEIYDRSIDSVVSITCTLSGGSSSGTGVVLSGDGYLVTNAHVVADARQIEVLLTDGRTFSAAVVGMDALSDLAVLYIDATNLTPARFGDSNQLQVGDAVVAIGDPLGVSLRGTMTDGIVSAINRNVPSGGYTMTLIQTNAALNSGNSGGPLINCFGQVIGINTMKISAFSDAAGVEGLGFAIPSATVKTVVDQLITQGYVSGRPALGVEGEWVSLFNQQFRRIPAGLYVTNAGSHTDLYPKDIILSVDGVRVTEEAELNEVLYAHQAGDQVPVVLYRNGAQFTVTLTLTEAGGE